MKRIFQVQKFIVNWKGITTVFASVGWNTIGLQVDKPRGLLHGVTNNATSTFRAFQGDLSGPFYNGKQ